MTSLTDAKKKLCVINNIFNYHLILLLTYFFLFFLVFFYRGALGGGGGGGGGGTQQSFIRGSAAPRSNPLPFYIPSSIGKEPLSYTFH